MSANFNPPVIAHGVCILVFRHIQGVLHVLGIEGPKGTGLPGGRIGPDEMDRAAALRELEEETGMAAKPGSQLIALPVRATDNGDIAHGFWLRERDLFGELRESPEGFPRWYPLVDLVRDRAGHPPVRFPQYNLWALRELFDAEVLVYNGFTQTEASGT